MRPIPKKLLIHKGVHKTALNEDAWGNKTGGDITNLINVRFEPSSKLVITKDNRQVQLSITMFFDCLNSIPKEEQFSVGDTIIFDDKSFQIQSLDKLYDKTKLHHLEMGLSI